MLEQQYIESENKDKIDYWTPLSKIILESLELRHLYEMSQADLAESMKTKQSVISRFENMGRLPNYDFIARLSLALNHSPGITLYGDYMAVVPLEKQNVIKEISENEGVSTKKIVQSILEHGIIHKINVKNQVINNLNFNLENISCLNSTSDELIVKFRIY